MPATMDIERDVDRHYAREPASELELVWRATRSSRLSSSTPQPIGSSYSRGKARVLTLAVITHGKAQALIGDLGRRASELRARGKCTG
jgi:hypothetical protein